MVKIYVANGPDFRPVVTEVKGIRGGCEWVATRYKALSPLLAPVCFASGPPNDGQGRVQQAKSWFNRNQAPAHRAFWGSGRTVRTGVPGAGILIGDDFQIERRRQRRRHLDVTANQRRGGADSVPVVNSQKSGIMIEKFSISHHTVCPQQAHNSECIAISVNPISSCNHPT